MHSKIDWSTLECCDPNELFLFSLRTGRKLPDLLHKSMILWSFDDKHVHVVKDYMQWVERCEARENAAKKTRDRLKSIEKMDRALNFAAVLVGILIFTALVISGKM